MEGCSEETTYVALDISEQLESEDPTVPPFSKAKVPSEISLILYLDKEKPLSEPRWVKTGDVQEWLRSMFGRMFWVAGDAADGWERRIEVADPDPVRTTDRAVPLIHIPTNVPIAGTDDLDGSRVLGEQLEHWAGDGAQALPAHTHD